MSWQPVSVREPRAADLRSEAPFPAQVEGGPPTSFRVAGPFGPVQADDAFEGDDAIEAPGTVIRQSGSREDPDNVNRTFSTIVVEPNAPIVRVLDIRPGVHRLARLHRFSDGEPELPRLWAGRRVPAHRIGEDYVCPWWFQGRHNCNDG